ncbi:uncharacterized protein LOC129607355 isoform X2 [Condylostylus longicornis]|nr:uncharacterized protein LOC129607355 isoform X2 [Condylostylus longicornis]
MKTLFDILDDHQTGYVKLEDIERGWQDDGSKGLPHGVIDSLRKVTPLNGLLSFERFCAGLKICLLRNQATTNINSHSAKNNISDHSNNRRLSSDNILVNNSISKKSSKEYSPNSSPKVSSIRPPSAPLLDIENPVPNNQWNSNTATVRPMPGQRALSLPQLSPGDSDDLEVLPPLDSVDPLMSIHPQSIIQDLYGGAPPKPPRTGLLSTHNSNGLSTGIANPGSNVINLASTTTKACGTIGIDKAEIRSALQNWQMGILMSEMESKDKWRHDLNTNNHFPRGTADGGSTEMSNNIGLIRIGPQSLPSVEVSPNQIYQKKTNSKRREPRRHTLQNGIDYNLLKRLKQYEEERDLLYQGFTAIEKAREWYLQQIGNVQEKIRYLGRMGSHVEQWSEVHQERLDFQKARVQEINRHLSTLADTWERGGFPMHMNLAVSNGSTTRATRGVLVRSIEKD